MFGKCGSLTNFTSDLSSLTDGNYMFYNCNALTTFTSDLSSLTNGNYMFYNCYSLKPEIDNDLSKLKNADYMFYNCFSGDDSLSLSLSTASFSNVSSANYMCASGGWPFSSFLFDLSSLVYGSHMFSECVKL